MKNVYYSLIYSHIIYAIEVWGSAFKTELDKILILQKRVMRLMTFNDEFPAIPGTSRSANPIFIKMNSTKVEEIYKFQVAKFVFKCLNQTTPIQFHNWYKLNHLMHVHPQGLIIMLVIKQSSIISVSLACTTNYGLKQIKVSGPRIWNELPSNLKNSSSINIFLKKLKIHYISTYG